MLMISVLPAFIQDVPSPSWQVASNRMPVVLSQFESNTSSLVLVLSSGCSFSLVHDCSVYGHLRIEHTCGQQVGWQVWKTLTDVGSLMACVHKQWNVCYDPNIGLALLSSRAT